MNHMIQTEQADPFIPMNRSACGCEEPLFDIDLALADAITTHPVIPTGVARYFQHVVFARRDTEWTELSSISTPPRLTGGAL
jgi:hypothetical protein